MATRAAIGDLVSPKILRTAKRPANACDFISQGLEIIVKTIMIPRPGQNPDREGDDKNRQHRSAHQKGYVRIHGRGLRGSLIGKQDISNKGSHTPAQNMASFRRASTKAGSTFSFIANAF